MRPILKWVGGKRQLLPELDKHIPARFGAYYEPFFGGGALFFDYGFGRAHISDANPHLLNFYTQVQMRCEALIDALAELERQRTTDDATFFLAARHDFNARLAERSANTAALFFAINRMGFNGLWRVNASGRCNVPPGKTSSGKHMPPLMDRETESALRAAAVALGTAVVRDSYADLLQSHPPQAGDFVYFDPPYIPASTTSDFTAYTAGGFGWEDQVRLRDCAMDLAARGVHVVLSNSDTPTTRELYQSHFALHEVQARRAVNCDASKRGKVGELIIVGIVP
jgi:DNA adenine methylase